VTSLLTNISAMTALTTLKGINSQLDATSNRVSTGQRVSTAADNAAYWSIATTVRTDNASLSAVKDSLGLGSSAVDTAYNGLNSILSDMQNLRAKLQTALQPGVDRAKVQTEVAALQSKMKATADSSNSSGQNWLSVNSSSANTAYQPTQKVVAGFSRDSAGTINFSMINVGVQSIKLYDTNSTSVTTAATNAQIVGTTSLTGTGAFSAGAGTADFSGPNEVGMTFTLGGVSTTLSLNAASLKSAAKDLTKVTTDEFLKALNNQISASSLSGKLSAGLDDAGRLTFTTTDTGSSTSLDVKVASPSANSKKLIDVGFGTTTGVATSAIVTGGLFSAFDLSGSNTKTISINDGTTTKNITLDAAAYTALSPKTSGSNAAVNGTDVAAMLNSVLSATTASKVSAAFAGGRITLSSSDTGTASTVIIAGADAAAFGFAAATTNGLAAGTVVARTGSGTNAGTTQAQGILDTNVGTYNAQFGGGSFSIANIDISKLVGTNGDADLSAVITAVDKAISKVTDAGTKLGASKTQIDGQKTFVDTLMKANDRTIGILVDADIEEESTKLKALQTQQQLAVQALSIANSGSQTVLSLFR